jgi:hypothetical protein
MVAVREDVRPLRQVRAARIDEIEAGQPVLARDLLGAQMLLHRHREVGAALDGRIVAHDHDLAPRHPTDAGDHAGRVNGVVVHAVRGERADLEKGAAGVDEPAHPLAGQQFSARQMPLARARRAAFGHRRTHAGEFPRQLRPGRPVGLRERGGEIGRGLDDGQGSAPGE